MNWNSGFSALYELKRVDPVTFEDMGSFEFVSGTIDRVNSGLMESADLTMTENPGECWIRVYLNAKQETGGARIPLFTGLTSAPERTLNGRREQFVVECYSVLKPVDDILVARGFYAPAGTDAGKLIEELLSAGPAAVVVDDESPNLSESVVAEDNMSRLDVAWLILDAIGWRLRIEGNGTIHISPPASEESAVFDTEKNDVIELDMTDTQDWFSVPNCIRVTSGDNCVEYKDDDSESPVSISARKTSRGGNGEIWINDSASAIGDHESLTEYAVRILKEKQAPARTVSYTRRYRPDVFVSDLVALRLPSVKINGQFKVTSQTVTLGYGCRTSEEVTKV